MSIPTPPAERPDAVDADEDLPVALPEGEVPDHGTPPTDADWDDGSADDPLPADPPG